MIRLCVISLLPLALILGLLANVGCTSPPESTQENRETTTSAEQCEEPENPYTDGTGHYAEYDWAEENSPMACGGSSQSFVEGCEEYQHQEEEFADCEARRNK